MQLAKIARSYGLTIDSCAEKTGQRHPEIERAHCIDSKLLGRLLGCSLKFDKDKNQRSECGYAASIDIGMYNTCKNGCRYCYANYNAGVVDINFIGHNPLGALISGEVGGKDKIYEREVNSCRSIQTGLFD